MDERILWDLDEIELVGKNILCGEYDNPEHACSFEIAALTDINDYTDLLGYPQTMIVIDQAVSDFAKESIIWKAGIQYEKEFDEKTEFAVENILRASPDASDFSWDSKIQLTVHVTNKNAGVSKVDEKHSGVFDVIKMT